MRERRYGLVFPGQGSQRAGMGRPWADAPQWGLVGEVSECSGHDVADLLLNADEEALRRTDLAQIAVFTVSLMALAAVRGRGLPGPVVACAGHSLGEYTALVAAGALTPREGATLVAARGAAMQAAARRRPGGMAAISGPDAHVVPDLTDEVRADGEEVWTANVNGPMQVVVSGTEAGVKVVAERARERRLKVTHLSVGGAFHSPLMLDALPPLREALRAAAFVPPETSVVTNADGHVHPVRVPDSAGSLRAAAERQLTRPVLWDLCVRRMTGDLGCTDVLEIGAVRVLAPMARRISPDADVHYTDGL